MTRQSPPGWTTATVGEACSIRNDLRLPISREERATMEGPYPYYGPTGQLDSIADFRLDGTFALIGEDGDHFLDVEKKPQTILVSGKFNVNNHAHVIESTDLCSAEWFYNYFRHRSLKPFLTRQGAGRYKLNKAALQEIPIVLPPPDEQGAINDLFREWNTAIQKTEQLIAAKERHFAATSHLLLTSRKRLKGFSMTWGLRRADEIFENTSRKGHLNEPLLSVTQERGVIPRDMLEGRVTMPSGETDAFKLVEPGNFVISLRSFQGGLEHSNYRGLVSPAYTVLKAVADLDERFFRHYFKSADFIKRLSVAVIGIRDGKQISFQEFCSIKLPFPAIDEQKAIAAFLDEAEGEIALLIRYTAALKNQKRGLMQKLLTGQWRLTVSAPQSQPGNR